MPPPGTTSVPVMPDSAGPPVAVPQSSVSGMPTASGFDRTLSAPSLDLPFVIYGKLGVGRAYRRIRPGSLFESSLTFFESVRLKSFNISANLGPGSGQVFMIAVRKDEDNDSALSAAPYVDIYPGSDGSVMVKWEYPSELPFSRELKATNIGNECSSIALGVANPANADVLSWRAVIVLTVSGVGIPVPKLISGGEGVVS